MRIVLAFAVLVSACGTTAPAPIAPSPTPAASAGPVSEPTAAELPLHFRGNWRDPGEQIVFSFDLRLERADTTLSGRILWTLIATPPGHPLSDRVNEVGTEVVVGEWDPQARLVKLKGTSVDSTLLATDEYKLTISPDGSGFTGKTRGHKGLWSNEITGERVQP
ncbi:MAG: hypothetical protein ACXWP4_00175 [Polyangiales bacterium]